MNNRSTALCLACASSPSPKAQSNEFLTPCCSRPICDNCLSRNPRLRGYNPCLSCLAGVAVVGQTSSRKGKETLQTIEVPGASGRSKSEEEKMFVLGDSDDEDGAEGGDAPPSYSAAVESSSSLPGNNNIIPSEQPGKEAEYPSIDTSTPSQYHIQPNDTLRGIALRFGIDGAKLCQMNTLPLSTLSTTPHLVHTRRILKLPPGKSAAPPPPLDPKTIEELKRERAEKRFQFVTKEVDWRVAKAYVALAEGESDEIKSKEDTKSFDRVQREGSSRILEDAVDQYLEDEEWERREGREPRIQGFPLFSNSSSSRKHE
ncbi:hypothetical protein M422DRAFT_74357 [Sphaerobolus stellatus SS14]|nr:hypothetical protein M422DRAFT_74357 [Sphaerobolus stellatus SS14]